MRKEIFFVIALMFLVSPAFADYRILLKNGREFIVEDYKESEGKIKFYKGGGVIELDKNSIESIKKIKASTSYEGTNSGEQPKKESSDAITEKGAKTKPGELESKHKEITKKKESLKTEKEKLMEEKKKLDEDFSKASTFMPTAQANELEQRASQLREKISKFNQELDSLNQEEDRILKEAEKQLKQQ